MNNDISDVNKYIKATNRHQAVNSAEVCHNCASNIASDDQSETKKTSMKNSMDYLGTMGYAQVSMNNPLTKGVKASLDSYLKNPEFVQEHNEMCDSLVKEGYPLEKAIDVTDRIFDTLKTEDTYK